MLRRCAVLFTALVLTVGSGACADSDAAPAGDGASTTGEPAATTSAAGGTDGEAAPPSGGIVNPQGDPDRPYGANRELTAVALSAGVGADDHQVEGNTIRLLFDYGSKDSPTAGVNCSAAVKIAGVEDRVELVYPDGTLDCTDPARDGS